MPHDPIAWYDAHAPELARTYEAIEAAHLHAWLVDLLPQAGAAALDVGAGTGRDAAWLASKGFDVVAVEPSNAMREQALALHPTASVRWVGDALPELRQVLRMGLSFDLILLSAVWMHVPEAERARAFRKLVTLLKPGGLLAITLRLGPAAEDRGMHPVSEAELERLARAHGAFVERRIQAQDRLGRGDVTWVQVAIRLPDDGTGALPLLRHVILNDDKSSTYKLALLRALGRIADGAAGYARLAGDDEVVVPLASTVLRDDLLVKLQPHGDDSSLLPMPKTLSFHSSARWLVASQVVIHHRLADREGGRSCARAGSHVSTLAAQLTSSSQQNDSVPSSPYRNVS